MRALPLASAIALMALALISAKIDAASANDAQLSMTKLSRAPWSHGALGVLRPGIKRFAASSCYSCGLCTDVDCCGGSAQGWKLCSCGDGTYKCCQNVATCP